MTLRGSAAKCGAGSIFDGDWGGHVVPPGGRRNVRLAAVSDSGAELDLPLHVIRASVAGPAVFVTAGLHGDEVNGTNAVRELALQDELSLDRGTLVLAPVLNVTSFDRHTRLLPDGGDLNRSFPGSASGGLAERMGRAIFDEIVARCDFGIDLHTAAVHRTSFPLVRADMSDAGARRLAEAFGCELVVDSKGPRGSLRREATAAGCPTISMEGGEVWKIDGVFVELAVGGVRSVLGALGMSGAGSSTPSLPTVIRDPVRLSAERGGFLRFHVAPGDVVEKGRPLATCHGLLDPDTTIVAAPFRAVVLSTTTLPAVSAGDALCHLGRLPVDVERAAWLDSEIGSRQGDGPSPRAGVDAEAKVPVVEAPRVR